MTRANRQPKPSAIGMTGWREATASEADELGWYPRCLPGALAHSRQTGYLPAVEPSARRGMKAMIRTHASASIPATT